MLLSDMTITYLLPVEKSHLVHSGPPAMSATSLTVGQILSRHIGSCGYQNNKFFVSNSHNIMTYPSFSTGPNI